MRKKKVLTLGHMLPLIFGKPVKTKGGTCPKEEIRETVILRCLKRSDVGIVA